MKNILFISVVMLCIYSCGSGKEISHREKETVKVIRETERDTIVVVSADSSWLKAWLECDSAGQVILKELLDYRSGKHIRVPEIKIVDNILMAKATVDSFGIFLTLRDKYETCISSDMIFTDRVIEVNHLKWWQKCLMWIGVVTMIVGFVYFKK